MYGTPAARSALVTWKLPLPTTPNACPTPSSAEQRADLVGDRRHVSTSASTRAGLPDPPTIGSGHTTSTAPVGGSAAEVAQAGQAPLAARP